MEQNEFIKGALIGGVIGGIAALLMAPKSGQEFREDIADGCCAFGEKTHNMVDEVKEQGNSLYEKGHQLFNSFHRVNGSEESPSHHTFFVGGTIGAVVGALAGLLLAPQAGDKLRERLGDKYEEIREKAEGALHDMNKQKHNFEDRLEDWKDTFSTLVSKLSCTKGRKGQGSSRIDEVLDLANLGLKLYHQLQTRR